MITILKFKFLRLLFLQLLLLNFSIADSKESGNKLCEDLMKDYSRKKMLTRAEVDMYCINRCDFVGGFVCFGDHKRKDGQRAGIDVWMKSVLTNVYAGRDDGGKWLVGNIDGDTFRKMFGYFFPWLLSALPVGLATVMDVHRNVGMRGMLFVFYIILTCVHFFFFYGVDAFASLLFAAISFQSAYAMTNSKIIYDTSSLILIIVFTSLIGLVLEDGYSQLGLGLLVVVGYAGLFYRKLIAPRREDFLSIVCLLLTFKMTYGYVAFMFNLYAVRNNALLKIAKALFLT